MFFTPVLAGGFLLESEWQQVSSCLQDFSQYSSRSQQCCCLDGLNFSTDFQFLQSLLQAPGDRSEFTKYNLVSPSLSSSKASFFFFFFFLFCGKIKVFVNLFTFFYFPSVVHRNGKIHKTANPLFFLCWLTPLIWPLDVTLKGTTKLGQSGLGSNSNEEVHFIP